MISKVKIGIAVFVALLAILILYANCTTSLTPRTLPTDSTSLSEVVEAVVSGTVNATFATGTEARLYRPKPSSYFALKNSFQIFPEANAQVVTASVCPTIQAGGTSCVVSANIMNLPFATCNFPSQTPVWVGTEIINHTTGSATLTCGSFPNFGNGDVIVRSFAAATGVFYPPNPNQLAVLVDTSGSVNGTPPITASGMTVSFTGAVTRNIAINGIHIAGDVSNYTVWSYLLSTSTNLLVNAGNSASGTVNVQDMINNRTATSTLTGLTYSNGCCYPTGGSVATSFSDGTSESLSFAAPCGTGTLGTKTITLKQCY